MFLRYEELPRVWPTVCEFVELPIDAPCITMRTRASEWSALEDPQRERIDDMYGAFAHRLAALPAVEVR